MMFGVGSMIGMTGAGMVVGAAVGAVVARRALVLITVSGESMSPTYADGEKLLVRRGRMRRPRVGDVVVFRHPQLSRAAAAAETAARPATAGPETTGPETTGPGTARPATGWRPDVDWMVKRVVAVQGDPIPEGLRRAVEAAATDTTVPAGRLLVRGDNPHSLDSRHFGYVPAADVLGIALRRRQRPA